MMLCACWVPDPSRRLKEEQLVDLLPPEVTLLLSPLLLSSLLLLPSQRGAAR